MRLLRRILVALATGAIIGYVLPLSNVGARFWSWTPWSTMTYHLQAVEYAGVWWSLGRSESLFVSALTCDAFIDRVSADFELSKYSASMTISVPDMDIFASRSRAPAELGQARRLRGARVVLYLRIDASGRVEQRARNDGSVHDALLRPRVRLADASVVHPSGVRARRRAPVVQQLSLFDRLTPRRPSARPPLARGCRQHGRLQRTRLRTALRARCGTPMEPPPSRPMRALQLRPRRPR